MVDFQNHRNFSLTCLRNSVFLASVKLKTPSKHPEGVILSKKLKDSC